jgi:hypothetical protein
VPIVEFFMDPSPIEDPAIRGTKIPLFAGRRSRYSRDEDPAIRGTKIPLFAGRRSRYLRDEDPVICGGGKGFHEDNRI